MDADYAHRIRSHDAACEIFSATGGRPPPSDCRQQVLNHCEERRSKVLLGLLDHNMPKECDQCSQRHVIFCAGEDVGAASEDFDDQRVVRRRLMSR